MMVTKAVFRKSSLEDIFFKNVVPGPSNPWSYHTDLLLSCLKFRIVPVCEYLNCYYNITNDYWAIPKEIQVVGFQEILFGKGT